MSHIAVWTDEDEVVQRRHYKPEEVDTSGCVVVSEEPPDRPDTENWVQDVLFYNDSDGFYYEEQDPFEGMDVPREMKVNINDAVQRSDLVELRKIMEQLQA